ncbi:outer membrane beta-barrel protein [Nibribacter ruber]|uniref:Outer membrane beta-barrel protein n=1 Tax=Nibribacter ruber TaxID=2698458 RepID=A0A6P1NYH1_9BACT|nr:porin family protein [Nibribacter ruber]QHL87279.1 outer membrane beta-barrel protein [Nibribacter ruber]
MAFTYFWHKLHLHRRKITLALGVVLAFSLQPALAQRTIKGENLQGYESKIFRWGFSLGMNTSWYQLEHSNSYVERLKTADQSDDIAMNAKMGIGFNVNFIGAYRLSPDFVVRLQPGVGYYSRSVAYKGDVPTPENAQTAEDGTVLQEVNTFTGEFPVLIKYESLRRKNTQMYFIAGVKPSIVVGGQKKDNQILQVGTSDFSVDFGVGLDMFYPFFKFAPELRFSRGITDLHKPVDNNFNNSIQRMSSNTITLYLNFE